MTPKHAPTIVFLICCFPFITWAQADWDRVEVLPSSDITDLIIRGDTLWASSGNIVYVSYDGGFGWGFTGPIDETVGEIYTMHLAEKDENTVYAGTLGQGIFVSKNGGYHWQSFSTGLTGFATRIVDIVERHDTLYVGTDGDGVYFRPPNADQWLPFRDGLGSNIAYSINGLLATDQALYAGAGAHGYLYYRPNGVNAWQGAQINPQISTLTALNFVETDGNILASTPLGIYRSMDQGKSWQPFGAGFNPAEFGAPYYSLSKSGNDLFLAISVPNESTYLFHSNDEGENWYFVENFIGGFGYKVDRTAKHIFFATNYGLWYTEADIISDDGEVPVQHPAQSLVIHAIYPNPTTDQVQVRLSLVQKSNVTVSLTDALGRKIKTFLSDELPAGENNFTWQLLPLPTGVYHLVFQTVEEITSKQLVKH